MSVSSISGYDPVQQMQQMQQLQALLGIQGNGANSPASSLATSLTFPSTSDQANFSKTGQMMSQLSQLQKSNPSEFSAVTQKISQDLGSQAASCGDAQESQRLTAFSQKFAEASQTGSMAPLASGHGSGRAHRAKGGSGGGALSELYSIVSQDLSGLSNAGAVSSNAGALSGPDGPIRAIDKIIARDLALASNAGLSGSAGPGQLMAQLSQLQQTNPAEFQAVTQKISQDLAAQAGSSTDPLQNRVLTDFSRKFADASQTGSMSSLRPGHHGHHGHQGSQASSTGDELLSELSKLAGIFSQDLSNAAANATGKSSWSLLTGLGTSANNAYAANNQSMGAILGSAVLS